MIVLEYFLQDRFVIRVKTPPPPRHRNRQRPARSGRVLACVAAWLLMTLAAPAPAEQPRTQLEAGGLYYDLDRGFAPTYGAYWRGRHTPNQKNQWFGEVVQQSRFDDAGTYGGLGHVHTFNDRWYAQGSVGTSNGGFFWPTVRADASVSRKWLADRRLVTTVGLNYFDAKDAHSDAGLNLEALYYTRSPWLFQVGTTINRSNPGAVISNALYGAVTYLRPQQHAFSLRLGGGTQAYQVLTADRFQVDVDFYEVRATWKQWVGTGWGVNIAAAGYQSSAYDQQGVEIGIFSEF